MISIKRLAGGRSLKPPKLDPKVSQINTVGERWKKPRLGYVELIVDATFRNADGKAGIDCVFRDHDGVCLGVFSQLILVVSSARHGMLLALLEGVRLTITHN